MLIILVYLSFMELVKHSIHIVRYNVYGLSMMINSRTLSVYMWFIVTTSVVTVVSKILPLLQCTLTVDCLWPWKVLHCQ